LSRLLAERFDRWEKAWPQLVEPARDQDRVRPDVDPVDIGRMRGGRQPVMSGSM
jgi:hypothetical protein